MALNEGTRADLMALVGLLQAEDDETGLNAAAKSLLTDTPSADLIRASLGDLWAQNELLFQRRRHALQDFFGKHETLAPELQESTRSSLVGFGAADKRRLVEYYDDDDEFFRRLKKKRRLRTGSAGGCDGDGGPQLCDLPDAILCQVYSLVPHKVCPHMAVSKRFCQCLPRAEKILLDIRKAEGREVRPESLMRFQSGVSLNGTSCWGLLDKVTEALAMGWTALESLDLSDNQVGDAGAKNLSMSLVNCKGLTSLSLSENGIGPEGATSIGDALSHFSKLSKLHLPGNRIMPAGAQHILKQLSLAGPPLKHLSLSGGFIGLSGVQALSESLLSSPLLTSLDLSACDLKPAGVTALVPLITANTNLKVLSLSRNEIEGPGATALAPAITACPLLVELNLNFNDLGPDGATALAPALLRTGRLMHLKLFGNAIGADGARYLSLNSIEGCMKSQMTGALRWRLRTFHI